MGAVGAAQAAAGPAAGQRLALQAADSLPGAGAEVEVAAGAAEAAAAVGVAGAGPRAAAAPSADQPAPTELKRKGAMWRSLALQPMPGWHPFQSHPAAPLLGGSSTVHTFFSLAIRSARRDATWIGGSGLS